MTHQPPRRLVARPELKTIDELLADISTRIQLTPGMHRLAVERYETLAAWIQRPGSPLEDRVETVYAQGSMAIGATIRSKDESDLFDIDVMVQAALPPGTEPLEALIMLERAIRGERGSRYDKPGMVVRNTRCVTVNYAEMRLDMTLQERRWELPERAGCIFHAKQEEPAALHKRVLTNPYGFAEWFIERTPAEEWFALDYAERSLLLDGLTIAKAASEPEEVPELEPVYQKAIAVVCLQLMKRWLQRLWADRTGRAPPSVLVAKLVAESAGAARTLSEGLQHHARFICNRLQTAELRGETIVEHNPRLYEERFTDRWPVDRAAQRRFIADLEAFEAQIAYLSGNVDFETLQKGLAVLFGEYVTGQAVKDFAERHGAAIKSNHVAVAPGRGTVRPFPKPAIVAPGLVTPPHTFWGSRKK